MVSALRSGRRRAATGLQKLEMVLAFPVFISARAAQQNVSRRASGGVAPVRLVAAGATSLARCAAYGAVLCALAGAGVDHGLVSSASGDWRRDSGANGEFFAKA